MLQIQYHEGHQFITFVIIEDNKSHQSNKL